MSDKFGLDYLIKRSKTRGGGGGASSKAAEAEASEESNVGRDVQDNIERATISVGNRILAALKRRKEDSGSPTMKLRELVDEAGVDWEMLNVVCKRLEGLNLLEVEPDRYGDHTLRLTKVGERSISSI